MRCVLLLVSGTSFGSELDVAARKIEPLEALLKVTQAERAGLEAELAASKAQIQELETRIAGMAIEIRIRSGDQPSCR